MPKILLVEDNEINRHMLLRRLVSRGYEVICATDGHEGIAKTRAESPDLILMDLSLPVLDGWDAAKALKSFPETSAIPIIAITAHAMPGDRQKALAAGCDEYDTKPIVFTRLIEKIETHLLKRNSLPPPAQGKSGYTEFTKARTGSDPSMSATSASGEAIDYKRGETDPLSIIRHSLRTPLNQIIGYSEMLIEEADESGSVFMLDLQRIQNAGGQLLAVINDGLASWRAKTGKINLAEMRNQMRPPVDFIIRQSELCQNIADNLAMDKLKADLRKISGAALNLLALFDSKNFPTEVEVVAHAKSVTTASARQDSDDSDEAEELGEPQREGEILLVDDNEMNRDMLCRRLERWGYKVTETENGQLALEILKTKQFDLVLLDVLMPVLNGFDTLQQIKADKAISHIPVVMISAMDEIDSMVRCIKIGAADYISKPINPILLNARISSCLEQKRLRDQEKEFIQLTIKLLKTKRDRI